ncbi:expansin EXLX1 family cellulose-binding protein [Streptomyces sp. NPDC016172]|uniref:expansin EXLX1 family cellulose-binding protein n=1 Tax=Streptomyces sp. NPDC016172 TaxID=3364964 RepID=UPI0037007729
MEETRQAARQRRQRRRLMVGSAAGLVVTGLLVCLVMTMQPDRKEDAGRAPATAVANSQGALPSASPEQKSSTPSPSATSATPSAGASKTPKTSAGKSTPRPSASTREAQAPATSSLAGRIRPKSTYQGVATVYKAGVGDGACSYGPSGDMMIAAMNTTDYETSKACGAYVLVRAENGASVTVRITNECPLPCAPGQLDLSEQAFAKLAPVSTGRISISWSLLSPDTAGTISIRYKNGSSPYWCGIQAIGHRNPLARLEVRAGGWRPLTRTDYNYFLSPDGGGCGGAIRITDIYGERLTINGIALRPDAVQPAGVQFARH